MTNEMNCKKNVGIGSKYAQYYWMIYNCTVTYHELTNPILENIFLSFLIYFRNGSVLETNIYGSQFYK